MPELQENGLLEMKCQKSEIDELLTKFLCIKKLYFDDYLVY